MAVRRAVAAAVRAVAARAESGRGWRWRRRRDGLVLSLGLDCVAAFVIRFTSARNEAAGGPPEPVRQTVRSTIGRDDESEPEPALAGRRRHRRRRRARRVDDRGVPRHGRPGRPAAGEDGLPAREGLRRRAHAPRGQGAGRPRHPDPRARTAGSATRACASSAAACGWSSPWPDLSPSRDYGLVRPRQDFDEILARHAEKAGARLRERTVVTGPVLDERTGRVVGRHAPERSTTTATRRGPEQTLPRAARRRRRRQLQPALRSRWA